MRFVPYVYDAMEKRVDVSILPMTHMDALRTALPPEWQTLWTSEYLNNPKYLRYAVKRENELIALGTYEVWEDALIVHIVYLEAQPESNPTMDNGKPKYTGIGRLLIAQGIKLSVDHGFGGDVILEAKTTALANHYIRDFGAVALPSISSTAPRFIIADDAAKNIFFCYLE